MTTADTPDAHARAVRLLDALRELATPGSGSYSAEKGWRGESWIVELPGGGNAIISLAYPPEVE